MMGYNVFEEGEVSPPQVSALEHLVDCCGDGCDVGKHLKNHSHSFQLALGLFLFYPIPFTSFLI